MSASILLLVDGTAMAYRAFYAIPELSTREGQPTNALFGFIRMLQQLELVWQPTHRMVVFDGGLPAERLERLPTYKAQRPHMPDRLAAQLEPIHEYLRVAQVNGIRLEGQEADDVMATVAGRAEGRGMQVLLATSDKDMYQVVDEHIHVVALSRSGERMGPEQVLEKTGVRPSLIVDWLALTGDSVDNIPGIPGVGPKTAARWLMRYGSLRGLLEHLDEVGNPKLKAALESGREALARNVELLTLRRDLPIEPDWNALGPGTAAPPELLRFYERMNLESLARNVRQAAEKQALLDFGPPGSSDG